MEGKLVELIQRANEEIEKQRQTVEMDHYRLRYHLMPPVGLLNDPNGFIQWNKTYHLFYQWMPFKTGHGAKFWGHYSSKDLVTWIAEPIALAPSDWYDKNGCYSGSAIVDDNKLKLFYTGNVKDEYGNRETYQCVAQSFDGREFEKLGVVATLPKGYTSHFRDPKVWKKDNTWYMIVGAQSIDEQGKAVLFRSDNLVDWVHLGVIAGSNENQLGYFGYMWECPDLFELNGEDVLLVSPQGLIPSGYLYQNIYQAGYFIGKLDYEQAVFSHGDFTELDRGFEFYAPQTTIDEQGRRLMFAWMGVPEQNEEAHPTIKHNWIHAMTLPRELKIQDERLYQVPVEELKLRRTKEVMYENQKIDLDQFTLNGISGDSLELQIDFSCNDYEYFSISFRNYATFSYEPKKKLVSLERVSFANGNREKRQCVLEKLDNINIYLDTSSIEIFLNGGEEVFSARIFPQEENKEILFSARGECVCDIKKWDLS